MDKQYHKPVTVLIYEYDAPVIEAWKNRSNRRKG